MIVAEAVEQDLNIRQLRETVARFVETRTRLRDLAKRGLLEKCEAETLIANYEREADEARCALRPLAAKLRPLLDRPLLTQEEAVALTGLHRQTIGMATKNGRLKHEEVKCPASGRVWSRVIFTASLKEVYADDLRWLDEEL